MKLPSLHLIESLELQQSPVWYPLAVTPGDTISIDALVEYMNINPSSKRKALLLIKAYDELGNEVNTTFNKMFWSKAFDAYFKYLAPTGSEVEELYGVKVPEEVVTIHFGFSYFLLKAGEQVVIRDLSIYLEESNKISEAPKELQTPTTYQIESLELSQDSPVWYPMAVTSGDSISIKALVNYINIDSTSKCKALLLIKAYDELGNEVEASFDKMAWSEAFDAHFKYLAPTAGEGEELYSLQVPEDVVTIHFGFSRFLSKSGEQVVIRDLSINPEESNEVSKTPEEPQMPTVHQVESLELQQSPVWYPMAVTSGDSISIKALVNYINIDSTSKRKALLLIKAYDELGNEVNTTFNKMFWSKAFDAYFKYLAPTGSEVEDIYSLEVPEGVVTLHIGFSRFLPKADEQVIVRDLTVNSKHLFGEPAKKTTKAKILSVENKTKEKTKVNKITIVTPEERYEIIEDVVSEHEYILTLNCITEDETNSKGAVADITFYDKDSNEIPKPYQGTSPSKLFGAYFYVETRNSKEALSRSYEVTAPKGAKQVKIEIVAFDCKENLKVIDGYEFIQKPDINNVNTINEQKLEEFNQILKEAEEIPDSNGSEYFSKHQYNVGVIGDIYMYNFYKDVFKNVYYLSPSNYQEVMSNDLDIVIYTTCWKGINNEEWRGVKFRETPKNALDSILEQAKKRNIKTVFQTIEDPSNFEYFLPVARKFGYILTTDTDCIERYKEELGHENVFYGEYGVNPQFNNPIGSRRNIRNAAFFAGSYPRRYEERCNDMEIIFDSIIESQGQLFIADRNFNADSEDLKYPARFQSNVLPPVQHDLLQKIHKLFRYNLNFNSIKQSPTMCAMRVYELQAQGNGFISNYANSVYNKFPGIRMIPFKQDMRLDFEQRLVLEEYRRNTDNIREVLNSKTSYHVVSTLLNNIGLGYGNEFNKKIAVICKDKTQSVVNSFDAQSYSNKILLVESDLADWEKAKQDYNIEYFCWFSSKYSYEKNYLNDLLNGFKYTDSHYITKNAYFDKDGSYIRGLEHEYTSLCSGKHLSLFSAKYLKPQELSSIKIDEPFDLSYGYSIDPFEVNYIVYMQNRIIYKDNFELSVIVPVYNNARFLISKCIPSLQRSRLWPKMEILLVDDGSTDKETIETLDYLNAIYPNITVKFNHGNGSGSASRPRNQGIDLAKASIVTFLDPDNEIAPGAYDLLVDLYNKENSDTSEPIDFISGFHVKVSEDVKVIGKHTPKELSVIKNFKQGYFDKGRFPVIATQSAVISKKLLNQHNIRFVEGSAGQDTLFGWELIANAESGGFTGEAYIIYYADRSDSITNKVDKTYFEKKLILEKEQVEFLKANHIFETYVTKHLDSFMKNWYLKKLENIEPSDYSEAELIMKKICALYNKDFRDYQKQR